jgi:hypothetical protein
MVSPSAEGRNDAKDSRRMLRRRLAFANRLGPSRLERKILIKKCCSPMNTCASSYEFNSDREVLQMLLPSKTQRCKGL